jgi:acetyltransferase-like isoleucine patch superfamily enzyme
MDFQKIKRLYTVMDTIGATVYMCYRFYYRIRSFQIAGCYGFGKGFQVYKPHMLWSLKYCILGVNFRADSGLWLECVENYAAIDHYPELKIGNNFAIGRMGHIGCAKSIFIGNDVLIGSFVLITDHGHGDYSASVREDTLRMPPIDRPLKCKPVRIGNSVWIGDHVSILPGAEIGDGAVIGAGAVISGKVQAGDIIVGSRENKIL